MGNSKLNWMHFGRLLGPTRVILEPSHVEALDVTADHKEADRERQEGGVTKRALSKPMGRYEQKMPLYGAHWFIVTRTTNSVTVTF
jgi:hypothetical protein